MVPLPNNLQVYGESSSSSRKCACVVGRTTHIPRCYIQSCPRTSIARMTSKPPSAPSRPTSITCRGRRTRPGASQGCDRWCRLSLLPVSSAIASRSNFVATYSRALPLATGTRGLERRRGRGILPVGSRGGVVHAWNASCALCEGADEREGNKAPALHILGWGGVGWGGVGWVCSARQLRIVVIVAPMLKDSLRSRRLATYTQLYLSRLTQLYLLCNQIGDTGDRCHWTLLLLYGYCIGRGALGTE